MQSGGDGEEKVRTPIVQLASKHVYPEETTRSITIQEETSETSSDIGPRHIGHHHPSDRLIEAVVSGERVIGAVTAPKTG